MSNPIVLFDANSNAKLAECLAEIATGTLWGISLGTTTKSSSYSTFFLVEATATRCENLIGACPEDIDDVMGEMDPLSFTAGDVIEKAWYLRGKIV